MFYHMLLPIWFPSFFKQFLREAMVVRRFCFYGFTSFKGLGTTTVAEKRKLQSTFRR